MRDAWRVALAACVALACAAAAHAQSTVDGPPAFQSGAASRASVRRAPTPAPQPLGFRAYILYGSDILAARKTFDAVLGIHRVNGLGAGAEVLNLWHGAFVRVDGSSWSRTGSRVDTSGNSLGISTVVKMTPIEIGGGWRTGGGPPRAASGVAFYVGGGLVRMRFRETSDFAAESDNVDQTTSGYDVFAGVELRVLRSVIVGAEGGYRRVPNAIGTGGISQTYNETDLGGGVLRFLVGIRR